MRKRTAIALSGTLMLALASGYSATDDRRRLILTQDGKPASAIALPAKPTRAAQLAAYELQHHVRLMTEATLPVVMEDDEESTGARIMVGATREAATAGLEPDAWRPQEYAVRFGDNALILAGQDEQNFEKVKYGLEDPFAFSTRCASSLSPISARGRRRDSVRSKRR